MVTVRQTLRLACPQPTVSRRNIASHAKSREACVDAVQQPRSCVSMHMI